MRSAWVGALLIGALVVGARADTKRATKAGKGFWKVMVKPNAKWVLHPSYDDDKKQATITVETYDVRKVDGADVARLRWTYSYDGKTKEDIGSTESSKPTQVAVTDKGLYLLIGKMDDAAISEALKKKPSRSDPPKAYEGTKLNNGRYMTVDGGKVCMGDGPLPGTGDCPDVCDGRVCWTADGVVEI